MAKAETVLRVRDLRTFLDTPQGVVRAVDSVSFTLERGRTLALLGESGCGKSMTALSLLRLVPEPAGAIVGGSVELDGEDLLGLPERTMRQRRGRRIAMIFQEPMSALNPVLTVGQQIGEVLKRHFGLSGAKRRERILALLREVRLPDAEDKLAAYPHQLSGGMKQRVGIAIALAGEPDVLIADEPTTALDVTVQAQILQLLAGLQRERQMAMLLITHDLAVVRENAHRVAVMYAGHIVEEADRDALFAAPAHPYTRKLFESIPRRQARDRRLSVIRGTVPALTTPFRGCRFADRCDFAWQDCHDTAPRWMDSNSGSHNGSHNGSHYGGVRCHLFDPRFEARPPPAHTAAAEDPEQPARTDLAAGPLLEVRDLEVYFPIRRGILKRTVGHVRAVDGVSLAVSAGKTLALVGESGCGKTSLGLAVLQLQRPTGGSVAFDGDDLARLSRWRLRGRRRELQMIFQDPFSSMDPRMRILDIILEGMRAQRIGGNARARERRAVELLEEVGLSGAALERFPHEFSGGQRQRICIARALAVDPRLIVCDEPTSALDVSVQAQVLNLLRRLQREHGLGYLFISHNMAVVGYVADEVAVMNGGKIVEHGPVEEIMTRPRHDYTKTLLAAAPTLD